ncbi:hypothetical protein U879_09880 [Defluviimonas sp. 20V17]|uniref:Uncharacterized conserved protein YjiS, DUF1127 family n=1 Tax=Allgaiera indica TaxID=765699 RepID=A0AAN4ZYH6_9RHOB|nr:DUF1127 domain-containing protein [Allgaiera indica]KDB03858.1 hypothetical protein U879_09880 [Defluviimonas sp. 20V17]GHE00132.1 hypothetical protein GCM10008024_10620 [Allgaiera indica]SDW36574.1 Uncharacterized conserved protein YjiS, DUF1127 family [Allgaiera indica]
MAAYETTRPAPLGAITTFHLVQSIWTLVHKLRDWNDVRLTRHALDKLSDRELEDIGLCRGDIDGLGKQRL